MHITNKRPSPPPPIPGSLGTLYTTIPSPPDPRDYKVVFQQQKSSGTASSSTASVESYCPPVFDQGRIGSCTANASACMYYCVLGLQSASLFIPSRLYIYYNTRVIENTVRTDSGATLRDTMSSLTKYGTCDEKLWPYDPTRVFSTPPNACYTQGRMREALSYASVSIELGQMRAAIQSGYSFVLGFLVYSSFESAQVASTGNVPVPNTSTEQLLGGHAVCVVGYDDNRQVFIVRNSWGTGWGANGDFYMPYAYATNTSLCFDAWVLYKTMTATTPTPPSPPSPPSPSTNKKKKPIIIIRHR